MQALIDLVPINNDSSEGLKSVDLLGTDFNSIKLQRLSVYLDFSVISYKVAKCIDKRKRFSMAHTRISIKVEI